MQKFDLAAVLRRSGTATASSTASSTATATLDRAVPVPLPEDALQWSWPPYAPVEVDHTSFDTEEWAPASVVWHPQVRVGRWTVVYRRAA